MGTSVWNAPKSSRISGRRRTAASSPLREISSNVESSRARTVADRSVPSIAPASPKQSPAANVFTVCSDASPAPVAPFFTSASKDPAITTNALPPGYPCCVNTSP